MKDALICLRISSNLRSSLRRISELDRRSLSSTIENILHAYAEQRRSAGHSGRETALSTENGLCPGAGERP